MRLETLTALYRQKHGEAAAMALIEKREMYLSEKLPLIPAVLMAAYPDFAPKSEIERLLIDGATQKAERSEAIAGAQRQAWNQQRLERAPEGKNQPDFYEQEIDAQLNRQRTVDFMYTAEDFSDFKVMKMNENIAKTPERWEDEKDNIQKHLRKADIVPLDLRRLTALNRSLIINYVLSLPEEQRSRIELIVRKSK